MKSNKGTASRGEGRDTTGTPPPPPPAPSADSKAGGSSAGKSGFFSRPRRQAKLMCKHVLKLVNHQRDILPPQGLTAVTGAMDELKKLIADRASDDALDKSMENLGKTADKWIKPYPHATRRENVEVLLVA